MKHDALPIRFLNVFVQLLSSVRLIKNNTSLNLSSRCLVKSHNIGSLSNPTRAPSLNEDRLFGVAKGGSFRFPQDLFRSTLL